MVSRLGLLILLLPVVAAAQDTTPRTFVRLDVTDTPVGLPAAILEPPGQLPVTRCAGRVETAQVRFGDVRAVTVAATTGRILDIGDTVVFASPGDAAGVRFVKTGSTTAVVMVECGR